MGAHDRVCDRDSFDLSIKCTNENIKNKNRGNPFFISMNKKLKWRGPFVKTAPTMMSLANSCSSLLNATEAEKKEALEHFKALIKQKDAQNTLHSTRSTANIQVQFTLCKQCAVPETNEVSASQ